MATSSVDIQYSDEGVLAALKLKDDQKALKLALGAIKAREQIGHFTGHLAWLYERIAKSHRRSKNYQQEIGVLETYLERIGHEPIAQYEVAIARRLDEVRQLAAHHVPDRGTCEMCKRPNMMLTKVDDGASVCRTCLKERQPSHAPSLSHSASSEVANWMYQQILEHGKLPWAEAALQIRDRFGSEFVPTTKSGGTSIARPVLDAFKKLVEATAVWDSQLFCWRNRQPPDRPGWRQSGHEMAWDPELHEYMTVHDFQLKYSRPTSFSFGSIEQFRRFEVPLAGVSFVDPNGHDRQAVLAAARPSTSAQLVREPENIHDTNAIAVYVNGRRVGYVPAETAKQLVPIIESQEWMFVVPHMWINEHDGQTMPRYSANMMI